MAATYETKTNKRILTLSLSIEGP